VLFSEKKISSVQSIIPALELANQVNTDLTQALERRFFLYKDPEFHRGEHLLERATLIYKRNS
jgi:hypothetical protein